MFMRKKPTRADFRQVIKHIQKGVEELGPEASNLWNLLGRVVRAVDGRPRRRALALRGCLNSIDIKQRQRKRLDKLIDGELERAKTLLGEIERDLELEDRVELEKKAEIQFRKEREEREKKERNESNR